LTGDVPNAARVLDLWRDPSFRRFWAGEAISLLGSQITALALPLSAVLLLDAGPAEMAILGLLSYLPFLVVTLPAGVWADRRRRRPLLLVANVGRAVALLAVPAGAWLGVLSLPLLYGVALVVGVLTVLFEVGYLAYVPHLVARHQLVDANARLQATASAAEVGGPGIGGLLIAAVGAPVAILIDSASYLASAVLLLGISRGEPEPAAARRPSDIVGDIRTGLRVTFSHPVLRAFALAAASNNLAWQIVEVVLLIYATQVLRLDPLAIGTLFSVGATGAVLGAVAAGSLGRLLGVGRTIAVAMVLCGAGTLLVPLATPPSALGWVILAIALFIGGFGNTISVVHVITVRQTITPDDLLGRMNASYRTLTYGAIPVGAMIGGVLGETIGLQATMAVGAVGVFLAPLWVLLSPVPGIRDAAAYPAVGSPGAA
jgi:MFS family permease